MAAVLRRVRLVRESVKRFTEEAVKSRRVLCTCSDETDIWADYVSDEEEAEYRKWKDQKYEILKDIKPLLLLTKDILSSQRYMDGAVLTVEDEQVVVKRLLAYHPHYEDKIGCGLESIMALLLRACFHNYKRFTAGAVTVRRRSWCSAATNPPLDEAKDKVSSGKSTLSLRKNEYPSSYLRLDENEPEYRKWKDKENEIMKDIEPILSLTKDILHSERYMDGTRLTVEDEQVIVKKLLAYHPHSEDKIGCGLESIMVDRHPIFQHSRCLFIIRTDGGWIDFSYQRCLREYIREKYPAHAERFIREHLKRGSG